MKIPLKMAATAPISHLSDERAGNTVFFRRLKIQTPEDGSVEVPVVSGNSLRGKLRRIAVRCMLRDLGVSQARLPLPL